MGPKYWVAGHITGFFEICDSEDPLKKGSRGAGFCINRGVTTEVSINQNKNHEIKFNSSIKSLGKASVTENVLTLFEKYLNSNYLNVNHTFDIPIGAGFGASAASAIGVAFAINDLLKLNLSEISIWQIAHKAEIMTGSGLGDVLGLFEGGIEFREQPGSPKIGKVSLIKDIPPNYHLYTISLGKISTKLILSNPDYFKLIKSTGAELISLFSQKPTFDNFLRYAEDFTEKIGLLSPQLKELKEKLNKKGIRVAQIMLGEGLFTIQEDMINFPLIDIHTANKEDVCFQTVKRL